MTHHETPSWTDSGQLTWMMQGPVAVPKEALPKTLTIKTFVNGELRQHSTSDDLIFSIPELIKTMSEGQTLQLGDVLATGTVSNP